jgi:hypothetical protein
MKVINFISVLFFVFLLAACSWHSTIGENNRYHIDSSTQLFAPSVTLVTDTKTNYMVPIGGQSLIGQLSGPASAAIGGYFIGEGLKKSGTTVSNNNGGNNTNNSATSNSNSSSFAGAVSSSRSSVNNSNINNLSNTSNLSNTNNITGGGTTINGNGGANHNNSYN